MKSQFDHKGNNLLNSSKNDTESSEYPVAMSSFYDVVFESEHVSVGKDENGYFFSCADWERCSDYFDEIVFDEGLFRLKKDALYGLANAFGNTIISPRFCEIRSFSEGLAAFENSAHVWGYLNAHGEIAISPIYSCASDFKNGYAEVFLWYEHTRYSGCINSDGYAVTKGDTMVQYSNFCFIAPYCNVGYIGVKFGSSGRFYFVPEGASNSDVVLQNSYSYGVTLYDEKSGLYGVIHSCCGECHVMSCSFLSITDYSDERIEGEFAIKTGQLVTATYTGVFLTEDGAESHDCGLGRLRCMCLSSVRDKCGCWLFDGCRKLNDSCNYTKCVEVLLDGSEGGDKYVYVIMENGKYGVVDCLNNKIIKAEYDELILPMARLCLKGEFHESHSIYDDSDGRVLLKKDEKWYLYSYSGNCVCENGYNEVLNYSKYTYIVRDDTGWGIMVYDRIVSPCIYDSIKGDYCSRVYILKKGNKYGLIVAYDSSDLEVQHSDTHCAVSDALGAGNFVSWTVGTEEFAVSLYSTGLCYDSIEIICDGHYLLSIDGCKGVLSHKGAVIIPVVYSDVVIFYGRTFKVSVNGRVGVADSDGKIIVPVKYDDVDMYGMFFCKIEKSMFLYTSDGQCGPSSYESIRYGGDYYNGKKYYYVRRQEKTGLITFSDNVIEEKYPCVFDKLDARVFGDKDRCVIDGCDVREYVMDPYLMRFKMPEEYLWMSDFSYRRIAIAVKNGRFGLLDSGFNELRQFEYDNILKIDAFLYLISREEQTCLVYYGDNLEEKVLATYEFDLTRRLFGDVFCVRKGDEYGAYRYNRNSESLDLFLDIRFHSISVCDKVFIIVEHDGMCGCYDSNGNILLAEKYLSIEPLYGNENRLRSCKDCRSWWHCKDFRSVRGCKDFLYGNILLAKQSEQEDNDALYTLYSYKSKKSVTIDMSSISIRRLSKYKACFEYIDSKGMSRLINRECSSCSEPFSWVEVYDRGMGFGGFFMEKDGLWGYIDYETFNAIPIKFRNGVAFAESSQRFWCEFDKAYLRGYPKRPFLPIKFYDSKYKKVCPIQNMIGIQSFSQDKWLVYVETDGKKLCGLYDDKMEVIIPASYDWIKSGIGDQCICVSDNGTAIYNLDGSVSSPLFDGDICIKSSDNGGPCYYCCEASDGTVSISHDGINFFEQDDSEEEIGEIPLDSDADDGAQKQGVNRFGKIEETSVHDGITVLKVSGRYVALKDGRLLSVESHERIVVNKFKKYLALIDGDSYRFIDYEGNVIGKIKGSFSTCILQRDAKVIYGITKGAYGKKSYELFSDMGTRLNDTIFGFVGSFSEDLAACCIDNRDSINRAFFERINNCTSLGFGGRFGRWGLVGSDGKIVIPMEYDFIRPVREGRATYLKDGKFGVISLNGNSFKTEYKYLGSFSEGLCPFRIGARRRLGFINQDGVEVVPPLFEKVSGFKSGAASVKSSSYVNQIDARGNLLHEWKRLEKNSGPSYAYDDNQDDDYGYTQSELDDMYRGAYDGDSDAIWNTD